MSDKGDWKRDVTSVLSCEMQVMLSARQRYWQDQEKRFLLVRAGYDGFTREKVCWKAFVSLQTLVRRNRFIE